MEKQKLLSENIGNIRNYKIEKEEKEKAKLKRGYSSKEEQLKALSDELREARIGIKRIQSEIDDTRVRSIK